MTRRVLVLLALFVAAPAAAETKSFAAVKGRIPAGTGIVLGIDLKAAHKSPAFPKLLDVVYAGDKDVKQMADTIKSACAIDAITAITDVTVLGNLDSNNGVAVLGLDGVDEPKAIACIGKVFSALSKTAVKITSKRGTVSEYAVEGSSQKVYAAWLAKDVVAVAFQVDSRTALDALLAGKPAAGDLATFLGKASGIAWAAVAVGRDGIRGGYGGVTVGKGVAKLTGNILATDDAAASGLLVDTQKQLTRAIKRTDKAQAGVQKLLEAVKVNRTDATVTFEASAPEADLPALLPALDKVL